MHRFWVIEEMVRLLASDLIKRCKASASAVALACCSKLLSDVVLDSVWEELRGLSRLMRCLPPGSWEIRDGEFVFLRCPSAKEWIRFSSYARRIRTFHEHGTFSRKMKVSSTAYHLISMQTRILGQYLLPNLRSIRWHVSSWDIIPFLRLFLNPGLIDVEIDFPSNDSHVYRSVTVSLIPTKALTHLRLGFVSVNDPLYMDALCNLLDEASGTLTSIGSLGQPSMAVVKKLLQLPNLRLLDVQLPETRISPPPVVFPSLEKLFVGYTEGRTWLHILRNIPNPALREFGVIFWGTSPTYLQTLGTSLLDANIHRTLTSFKGICLETIPLTEAGVRPFLSFKRLTNLELPSYCLDERCGFQLNDSIICELAAALPQLTNVELGDIPYKTCTSDVTITSLVAFSTNCVDLDCLRLHFDAKDIIFRGTYANSQPRRFTCKLRTLVVGSLPLPSNHDDILFVAFTILHIFPHLETISSAGQGWNQVGRAVELFQKAPRAIPVLTTN